MYTEIARVLVVVASAVITAGLYAQLIKLFRTKSVEDFSPLLVVALLGNEFAWLNYGLALREWPIILVGLLNVPAAVGIALGYWRYNDGRV